MLQGSDEHEEEVNPAHVDESSKEMRAMMKQTHGKQWTGSKPF